MIQIYVRTGITAAASLVLALGCASARQPSGTRQETNMEKTAYPESRAERTSDVIFGQKVDDPYRWLEDAKSAETQAWMKSQAAFARARLDRSPHQRKLRERLKEISYIESVSTPYKIAGRYFYFRRHPHKEKAVLYWREGEGPEKVLLDPDQIEPKGKVSLGNWSPSWDGRKLAYNLRENNADEATMYVMDIDTGKTSAIDVITGAKYAGADWTPDNSGFYYTWLPVDPKIPVAERPGYAEVRFHKLGTDPKNDPVIFPATRDPKTFIGPNLSKDGRWLFVSIWRGWDANDIYMKDLRKNGPFKPIFVKQRAQAFASVWQDRLYIITNHKAPRYKIMTASAGQPERKHWRPLVPEMKDAVISSSTVVGGHLALILMKNATEFLEIYDLKGRKVRAVPLPGLGNTSGLIGQPDDDEAYFQFNSFTTPTRIFKTSMKSGETSLWAKTDVKIDPSPFTVEQVFYPSKDGTKVSMFIVRRKDMPRDGSTPFLLYGYGGFNVNLTPYFSAHLYPWLEAGGGYAVANLRGGGEYGEDWHRAGMRNRKQNVFDDFIAAGEFLAREKYTAPERLAIEGRSNGGLLMGAALTQRPELFKAVVCGVPLLDMVRYHLFGSGQTWIPEYGDPRVEADFKALHAYSPYHRVRAGTAYPATLFLATDSDDRVDPMHARKMAALLQNSTKGPGPVLLRIQENAGHGGADLILEGVKETADVYSFLFEQLLMRADKFRD